MLAQVLQHMRNWFLIPGGVHEGVYAIHEGSISLPFLKDGQYFRICESVFNDGVYQYGCTNHLIDETFDGVVWALAVPGAVLDLVKEIEAWQEKNGNTADSPYLSESFAGYSYTKAATADGGPVRWQEVFRSRLNPWRKVREL